MKIRILHTFSKICLILCLVLGFSQSLSAQVDFVGNVQPGPINPGTPFTVTIALESGGQLIDAAEVHLTFDPTILQVTNLSIAGNNQLTNTFVVPAFDNTSGTIDYSAGVQTPPATPVDANFDFLVVEFLASQTGTTSLNYVDPNPPIALTVAFLAGVDVLNDPDPIDLQIVGANNDPIADFTATPNPAETDQIISFNASTSSDPDVGDTLTYDWDFGDGATGSGLTIDHTYTAANTYNVILTVSDGNGGVDTENIMVVVNAPTVTTYTITPSAGPNGSISPDVPTSVLEGGNQTFTITPDAGYEVEDVLVGGISEGAITSYEFTNVLASTSISATFSLINVDTTPVITLDATATVNEGGPLAFHFP